MEISKKKGDLIVLNNHQLDNIELLQEFARKNHPLYFVCNTDKVITKVLESDPTGKVMTAVEKSFPGLNFENFYFQAVHLNQSLILSVVKREIVEGFVDYFKKIKLHIAGISIGPTSLSEIWDFVKDDYVLTNSEKISLHSNLAPYISITENNDNAPVEYDVNGLRLSNSALLSFSVVLKFLSGDQKTQSNLNELNSKLGTQHRDKKVYGILLQSSIVTILILLLVNFVFFSYYFKKIQQLEQNTLLKDENKTSLTRITSEVAEKEKKVEAILSFSNSKTSFYLDRLAVTVPESILLEELIYQPLSKPVRPSKSIELKEQTIQVIGICRNNSDFSEWISNLEKLPWIESLKTRDYDYENETSSNFKILVHVTEIKK
ncbi:PilN domain-containing protein [Flagellimonas nanhaiensis]|uniref:PilN domain-containing protein n=1 Tax=Flagellimonas nanhaiensis TaxID=2292706 RepID=UPI0011C03940|nr:hypothetical protein [Allomuricauda nanhaiensis]